MEWLRSIYRFFQSIYERLYFRSKPHGFEPFYDDSGHTVFEYNFSSNNENEIFNEKCVKNPNCMYGYTKSSSEEIEDSRLWIDEVRCKLFSLDLYCRIKFICQSLTL